MNQVPAVDYLREHPRRAARLEAKVNPKGWVRKVLAHHLRSGADMLSVGCRPGVILHQVSARDSSIRASALPAPWPSKSQRNSRRLEAVAPRRHS